MVSSLRLQPAQHGQLLYVFGAVFMGPPSMIADTCQRQWLSFQDLKGSTVATSLLSWSHWQRHAARCPWQMMAAQHFGLIYIYIHIAELRMMSSCSAFEPTNAQEAISPFSSRFTQTPGCSIESDTSPATAAHFETLRLVAGSLGGFIRQRWNRRPRTSWRALTRQWDKPWQMGGMFHNVP